MGTKYSSHYFKNMPRFEARHKVIDMLKSKKLWRYCSNHEMVLPICSRTGDVIEPVLKEQWFADSAKLFKICDDAVKSNDLKIMPKMRTNLWNHYSKSYTTKDWCISRQLWWGQQIPAFIASYNGESKWFTTPDIESAKIEAVKYFQDLFKKQIDASEVTIKQGS